MEKCAALIDRNPEGLRGKWLETYQGDLLCLELGCGKGRFTCGLAESEPGKLIVALEKVPDAMIIALERVRDAELANVRFIDGDAAKINELFANGEVGRLYINFCDPWPKSRDAKLRLTAPAFLRRYADALTEDGQIHFKTDNRPLFDWSVEQLSAEGWALSEVSNDYHSKIMTDYEAKFVEEGIQINHLIATKCPGTKGTAAGEPERLRNASLSDARNC